MFSKKEVFESYVGQLGLCKTAFEAVKNINNVLFESSIDDELDEFYEGEQDYSQDSASDADNTPDLGIEAVGERGLGNDVSNDTPSEDEVKPNRVIDADELSYKKKVPYQTAYREATNWARQVSRFDGLWNEYRGINPISFMVPGKDGRPEYYNEMTVPYVISAEGEGAVPKYEYPTATNPIEMSQNVYDRIMHFYETHGNEGMVDLTDIPFSEIKRLVLGNGIHRTGEEAPNIGVACTVNFKPSTVLLSNRADDRDIQSGIITPNEANRAALKEEYGLDVESMNKALLKEWTEANGQYYMDDNTGLVYDLEHEQETAPMDNAAMAKFGRMDRPKKKVALTDMRQIDWAKTQDMFKLLLIPNAAGLRKAIDTSAIYKVPNNNIEGIRQETKYVYMDDKNYDSYLNSHPDFDKSTVETIAPSKLTEVVSQEYSNAMGNADKSGSNSYGYDEKGWVKNIECVLKEGKYTLTPNSYEQIRASYGKNVEANNYIAGKNYVDGDGQFHPLVLLRRTNGGRVSPFLVAIFDDSCCNPTEEITKIVGKSGLNGDIRTIQGYAIITNGCNLTKAGDFLIKSCVLSNVDIHESTGYVQIGTDTGVPAKTTVENTTISVGNNGANQVLPNNQIAAETVDGLRGVKIVNSEISNSTIANGYAKILNSHIKNLTMTNAGSKDIKEWNTDDASNVEFKGDKFIRITGKAVYEVDYKKSTKIGGKGYSVFEAGDVTTSFSGRVVLDSSTGNVTCSGARLNNVVLNGPCKIRTCVLNGTTVGVNANADGDFKATDLTGVTSEGTIRIEHGTVRPTVLGDSDNDMTSILIKLSGRVYIEGGAYVSGSDIHSEGDNQWAYVRSNMHLEGCLPYTLNLKDSGVLSTEITEEKILRGDCTDLVDVERRMQLTQNTFGGAADKGTPTEKYNKFKAGAQDAVMTNLSFYNSNIIIEDFLQEDTSSILMDKSVFMDITEDGKVVPNENLKRTIWDPIGGFFVGAVNRSTSGSMILLKCPNVVLDHAAIIRKKHEFGQDLDYKAYASGVITLRQYVNFLKKNGYTDCFHYVETPEFGKEFVQLCYINPDTRTPYVISRDDMITLCNNDKSKRAVQEFLYTNTNKTRLSEVDTADNITSASVDRIGTLSVEIDGGRRRYVYTMPKVNHDGKVIQSECTKSWFEGNKAVSKKTTIDCGKDAMYRHAYEYLVKHSSSNAPQLKKINAALSGNIDGLATLDYAAKAVQDLSGNSMQSNEIDQSSEDALNQLKRKFNLTGKEDLYFLQMPAYENSNMRILGVGKIMGIPKKDYTYYKDRGLQVMSYRFISKYLPETDTFAVNRHPTTVDVKNMHHPASSTASARGYLLYRPATVKDFEVLLHYPKQDAVK